MKCYAIKKQEGEITVSLQRNFNPEFSGFLKRPFAMRPVCNIAAFSVILQQIEYRRCICFFHCKRIRYYHSSLSQSQARGFFLYFILSRRRKCSARETKIMCLCHAGHERCS